MLKRLRAFCFFRWSCHVDDDTYLNVATLRRTLAQHDHSRTLYIGRSSLNRPVTIGSATFEFATGAAFCISRPLLERLRPHISRFGSSLTPDFEAGDDVTLGYLVGLYNGDGEHSKHEAFAGQILRVPLTEDRSFHSHLEAAPLRLASLRVQVCSWQMRRLQTPHMFRSASRRHLLTRHQDIKCKASNFFVHCTASSTSDDATLD